MVIGLILFLLVLAVILVRGLKEVREYNKMLDEIMGGKDGMEDDVRNRKH